MAVDGVNVSEEQSEERPTRRRRPILALLAANTVHQIGNMMTMVALPWFVLETTGSAALTGLAAAALTGGTVISGALGGPLVDRLGFRRASILGDVASGVVVASIPALHLAGVLQFWQLIVIVFLQASINAQGDTAKFALVPLLSTRAAMPLERANAAERAIARVGQVVGPVAAGILIVFLGAANVLFVQAATFAASAALLTIGVPRGSDARMSEQIGSKANYLSELAEGFRFVRRNPVILSMISIATIGNLLDIPLVQVVIPIYAREVFGSPESLGLILGGFGGGALLGTILFGVLGRRLPRRRTFLLGWVLVPVLAYGMLLLTPPLPVLVAAGLVTGLMAGPINPILLTVVQENVPPEMSGRVFGALGALAQAGVPLGLAAVGFIVEGAGILPTIAGMMGVYLVVTVGMFFNPALRRMEPSSATT